MTFEYYLDDHGELTCRRLDRKVEILQNNIFFEIHVDGYLDTKWSLSFIKNLTPDQEEHTISMLTGSLNRSQAEKAVDVMKQLTKSIKAKCWIAEVWDCMDMPDDVREEFYENYQHDYAKNNVYVRHVFDDSSPLVDEWLLSQGAVKTDCLILYRW